MKNLDIFRKRNLLVGMCLAFIFYMNGSMHVRCTCNTANFFNLKDGEKLERRSYQIKRVVDTIYFH